jgi:hypothetical protein
LVETYAEASAQVAVALVDVREERDLLRAQLEDLRRSYQGAERILDGTPLDVAVAPVLRSMAALAGVEHAAFWRLQPDCAPSAVALRGLETDPLLQSGAAGELTAVAAAGNAPSVLEGDPGSRLAEALTLDGRFCGVLAIPFRTPGGLQAITVFYYGADTARPGAQALARLCEMPRVLSSALELAATLRTVKSAERAVELALTGTASQHGLEHVVRSLERLREGLRGIRGRSDAPPWFMEQYVELAPALGDALESVRSLLAFGAGKLRRDTVVVAELLQEMAGPELAGDIEAAMQPVPGDPNLLRLALRAVADVVRARGGGASTLLQVRVLRGPRSLQVALRGATAQPFEQAAQSDARLSLAVARRIAELHGGTLLDRSNPAAAWSAELSERETGTNEVVLTLPLT